MKVVLAHDSYTQYGGAERVFEAIHELYPDSPVMTLAIAPDMGIYVSGWDMVLSPLQSLYKLYPKFQRLFPFIPIVLRFFYYKSTADVLLSSSSAYIKAMAKPSGAIHINYCHTTTRFIWTDQDYALREIHPILRPLAKLYFLWLKRWDYQAAQKVDYFIANSLEVQRRIKKYYQRDSAVIHPFVDVKFWKPTKPKGDYFLIAGRLAPYKNYDEVIMACNALEIPLHVVGEGRHESFLKSIAGPTIRFLGKVSDEALRDEYSGARAFVYPQFEDFGIMPLEAAACGTPTIGLDKGGSLETIVPGVSGELIQEATEQAIVAKLKTWDESKYDSMKLIQHSEQFSKEIFKSKMKEFINSKCK